MTPHLIIKKADFDILFTGIITEKVMDSLKQDVLISSFVTLEEASEEVGKISNFYKNDDIDLSILLTHVGYKSDIELAQLLKPEWGVDIIIGGHSHTILEKPSLVNGVLIAQAGVGTDQVGRFDITIDDDTNSIIEYQWQLIPIDEKLVEPDRGLENYINSFKQEVDRKYNTIICKFAQALSHPLREIETSLENLIADALADVAECDVMLVGSGSIRVNEMGPLVTLRDLLTCFPYEDILTRYTIEGSMLRRCFSHFMRLENRNGEGECYQVNRKVKALYSDNRHELISLKIDGKEVEDSQHYTLCLQSFHSKNSKAYLNLTQKELLLTDRSKVVSTSSREVLEEYLRNNQNIRSGIEGRLEYL